MILSTIADTILVAMLFSAVFSANAYATAFLTPSKKQVILLPSVQNPQQQQRIIIAPLFAKKGKNGKPKKKIPKKTSGMEWATSFTLKPFEAQSTRELVSTAVASFQGRTGSPLCDEIVGVNDVPKALWNAPLACVIIGQEQDTKHKSRTIVKYANVAALETVGLTPNQWDQLMWNPNPNAEHPEPPTTLDLPSEMKDKFYESGYQKKVVRKNDSSDHDIGIVDAHRWKLEKSALVDGKFVTTTLGIAYAWKEWIVDDSSICAPGGQLREKIDVTSLQQAVEDQASQVRHLKEEQGLGNKDPKVQAAVAELLRLKSLVEKANSS